MELVWGQILLQTNSWNQLHSAKHSCCLEHGTPKNEMCISHWNTGTFRWKTYSIYQKVRYQHRGEDTWHLHDLTGAVMSYAFWSDAPTPQFCWWQWQTFWPSFLLSVATNENHLTWAAAQHDWPCQDVKMPSNLPFSLANSFTLWGEDNIIIWPERFQLMF